MPSRGSAGWYCFGNSASKGAEMTATTGNTFTSLQYFDSSYVYHNGGAPSQNWSIWMELNNSGSWFGGPSRDPTKIVSVRAIVFGKHYDSGLPGDPSIQMWVKSALAEGSGLVAPPGVGDPPTVKYQMDVSSDNPPYWTPWCIEFNANPFDGTALELGDVYGAIPAMRYWMFKVHNVSINCIQFEINEPYHTVTPSFHPPVMVYSQINPIST